MSKKTRKKKSVKKINFYTKEERKNKINIIKEKLIDLGLGVNLDIKKLIIRMNIFIENGENYEDTIKLHDYKKKLIIFLNNNKKYEIYVKIENI